MPEIYDAVANVPKLVPKAIVQECASWQAYHNLFGKIRQPNTDYILVPCVRSEHCDYVSLEFMNKDYICNYPFLGQAVFDCFPSGNVQYCPLSKGGE